MNSWSVGSLFKKTSQTVCLKHFGQNDIPTYHISLTQNMYKLFNN